MKWATFCPFIFVHIIGFIDCWSFAVLWLSLFGGMMTMKVVVTIYIPFTVLKIGRIKKTPSCMPSLYDKRKASISYIIAWSLSCYPHVQMCSHTPLIRPTYQMNSSTFIMPCNYSGWTDPATVKGWGIVDFDWSNAKAYWAQDKPMLCEERMLIQAQKVKWASPSTRVWVYRNSIKALPW